MTMQRDTTQPAGGSPVERGVRHAAPKRDSLAMWGNLLIAHVWFAAGWVRGGWWPFAVGALSLLIAGLILYEDKITAAIAARAAEEHA